MKTIWSKKATAGALAGAVVATLLAVVLLCCRPGASTVRHIPTPDEVAELSAEMNGTFVGLPVTGTFSVPNEFYADVFRYVGGTLSKWGVHSKEAAQKLRLGHLHFTLKSGDTLDLAFYTVGRGAIGFSVDGDYFLSDSGEEDGGVRLLLVLDKARRAAGFPLPPPYPPPINDEGNISALTVSVGRGDPNEQEISNHVISASEISRVMRWLHGRGQVAPAMWPESQRLGVLKVTLKNGSVVQVNYYRSVPGEVRFSIDESSYRVLNPNSPGEDAISREVRAIVQYETLKKRHN